MKFLNKNNCELSTIAIMGTGYVGLPLINLLSQKIPIIAYDIDEKRIAELSKNNKNSNITFTYNESMLRKADVIIVCVPTPIDDNNHPNLDFIKSACITIAKNIKDGVLIIFESSYMPTCTENICIPLIEEKSGLKNDVNFYVGYSPERINPGDLQNTLSNISKLIASPSKIVLNAMKYIYSDIAGINVYEVNDIKIAELSKLVENCQRDLNIAFVNELSILCHKLNIDVHKVINSAGTKWNFTKYYPGLVGGGCVGVNSYYLMDLAEQYGVKLNSLETARKINSSMAAFIVSEIDRLIGNIENIEKSKIKIVIYGYSYKENISDARNTKVEDLYRNLLDEDYTVCICDYNVSSCQYVSKDDIGDADIIILAVAHEKYCNWTTEDIINKFNLKSKYKIFIDIKSIYTQKNMPENITYWNL